MDEDTVRRCNRLMKNLRDMFDSYDRRKNGLVRIEDIQYLISFITNTTTPPEMISSVVRPFDKQNKDSINFDEFCDLFVSYINHCGQGQGIPIQQVLALV